MKNKLTIAIQKSGRLSEKTIELLKKSGFEIEINGRTLIGKCSNFPLEVLFLRAQNIPEIVSDEVADLGICGQDTLAESKFSNLKEIEELGFGECRLVLAGKKGVRISIYQKRIATSFPNILKKYLDQKKTKAEIVPFSGSVEITPNLEIADLICDLVSTGSTLRMNGLEEIETIFKSQATLISLRNFDSSKKDILDKFMMRIRATLLARNTKYIIMNAPRLALPEIRKLAPGLASPTVTSLSDYEMISIASVILEDKFWQTIEQLKTLGASGILVLPIEKMIL